MPTKGRKKSDRVKVLEARLRQYEEAELLPPATNKPILARPNSQYDWHCVCGHLNFAGRRICHKEGRTKRWSDGATCVGSHRGEYVGNRHTERAVRVQAVAAAAPSNYRGLGKQLPGQSKAAQAPSRSLVHGTHKSALLQTSRTEAGGNAASKGHSQPAKAQSGTIAISAASRLVGKTSAAASDARRLPAQTGPRDEPLSVADRMAVDDAAGNEADDDDAAGDELTTLPEELGSKAISSRLINQERKLESRQKRMAHEK